MFTWLRRYSDFSGRSSRREYWLGSLCYFIIICIAAVLDGTVGFGIGVFYGLATLAIIVPAFAMSVRRLHDIEMTGWLVLLGFVPIVGLILLYWAVQPGQPRDNRYGPPPPETPGLAVAEPIVSPAA